MSDGLSGQTGRVAERRKRGFNLKALAAVVAPFVLAGLSAEVVFNDDYSIGLALWQAFFLWPAGGSLLAAPVAIAGDLRIRSLYLATMVLIAAAGVVSITVVAASDDAQAGIALLYAPMLGCVIAGLAIGLDRLITHWVPLMPIATGRDDQQTGWDVPSYAIVLADESCSPQFPSIEDAARWASENLPEDQQVGSFPVAVTEGGETTVSGQVVVGKSGTRRRVTDEA